MYLTITHSKEFIGIVRYNPELKLILRSIASKLSLPEIDYLVDNSFDFSQTVFVFSKKRQNSNRINNFSYRGRRSFMSNDTVKMIERKPFDLQEAVILLEVYLLEKKARLTRKEASIIASDWMRSYAVQRGMTISDSFRSPMGLQNRLRIMGNLYEEKDPNSTVGTEVFRKVVFIYRNERKKYQQILQTIGGSPDMVIKSTKKSKTRIVYNKFVRTKKDYQLKIQYSSSFSKVYYALKSLSKKKNTGLTGMDIFLELDRKIKRKEILKILSGASWAKHLSGSYYIFYDKEQSERRKEQMDESIKKTENSFFAWLPSILPPHTMEEIKNTYKTVNFLLVQKKALSQPLFATTHIGQVENALKQVKRVFSGKKLRNNATKLLRAYVAYLREIKNPQSTQIEITDVDIQENWIRFDFTNMKSFERTVPAYCNINGVVIEGRNWARILVAIVELEISKKNPELEVLYKKPLFTNRTELPFLMKKSITGLNCSELSNGYWINVNWNIPRLMDIIRAFCLHCGYQKKQVMIYGIPKSEAINKREKKSTNLPVSHSIDLVKVEEYIKRTGLKRVSVQDLIDDVQPGVTFLAMKTALENNQNIIAMPGNRYVYADCFVDLDEAEECLGKILNIHFSQFDGYSNNQLLFGAAKQELSMFLNDNNCENIEDVYAIARFLFEKKSIKGKSYKFYPPHIFKEEPDYPMTLHGLMIHLAKINGGVLLEADAKSFLQKTMLTYGGMGQVLKISSSDTFLIYDDDKYLLSEMIGIDEKWCIKMHDQIDNLFRQANVAYVIPRDISNGWLDTLPSLPNNLRWIRLLLQQVIDKYSSIGFKSISADLNQSHHTLAAAFVPIDSPLQSFPDVVTLFMEERHNLPLRIQGEKLRLELRDAGILEANEMIYSLPKALNDYRFAWTNGNKTVLVLGNR